MTKHFITLAILLLLLSSCTKESIETVDENELITSVKLTFSANGTSQTVSYTDLDGDGGKNPTIDQIELKANTNYTLSIEVLDESKTPAINLTQEIAEEKDEHLFVYTPSNSNLFTYNYGDKDSRNLPVGLTGSLKTNQAASGKLKVQLRHQPPVNGKPTKDGTPTAGSDDLNIDFNVVVK